MKYALLLIGIVLMSMTFPAFAQTTAPTDTSNCAITRFDTIYTPFRISMSHDPAIKKTISDQHDDPASSISLEGADPTQAGGIDPATHLSFTSNSTDNWTITVNLDYKTNKTEARQVIADFYQGKNNELISSVKTPHTGLHFCGIYILHAIPAPHIFTNAEILEQAGKIEEEKFQQHDQVIIQASQDVQAVGKSSGFIAFVSVIMVLAMIVFGMSETRFAKKFSKEFLYIKNLVTGSIQYLKMMANNHNIEMILLKKRLIEDYREFKKSEMEEMKLFRDQTMAILVQHLQNISPAGTKIIVPEVKQHEIKPDKFVDNLIIPEETDVVKNETKSLADKLKQVPSMIKEKMESSIEKKSEYSSEVQKWMVEYKKPEYKGKLYNIYEELTEKVGDNPIEGSPELDMMRAITNVVRELKGWP